MTRKLTIARLCAVLCAAVVLCTAAVLCTATALAQSSAQPITTTTNSGPSAWVYVSSRIGTSNKAVVHAFTAAANGKLTPIPGSPFSADLWHMAANGKFLFGSNWSGTSIDAYKIESNGSIHYSASTDILKPHNCGTGLWDFNLDHTGGSLYDIYFNGDSTCSNNAYQSWNIVKSNGSLTYLGIAGDDDGITNNPTFTGSDQYAYTAGCYRFGPEIYGFKRNSNGALTQLKFNNPLPKAPSGQEYCPIETATDAYNHLVVSVQPYSGYDGPLGPYQLAIYTVHSDGSITTTSTYSNMPKFSDLGAMRFSPSGKLLAISSADGVRVFHFNGSQITPYTGRISTLNGSSLAWDKNNHLYVLSSASNRLAVFTVTPTSWKWVGSYTINQPVGWTVQTLPLSWQ